MEGCKISCTSCSFHVYHSLPDPQFLEVCFLCKKQLAGHDIFMYRGTPFCTQECRLEQMKKDAEGKINGFMNMEPSADQVTRKLKFDGGSRDLRPSFASDIMGTPFCTQECRFEQTKKDAKGKINEFMNMEPSADQVTRKLKFDGGSRDLQSSFASDIM